ncbi:MAG: hypothetical protein DCC55_17735 [Chloroflexi bacterium]|nr:MAG: hypothetical protein DCC55_17735 [Chloroflexota bacterium]
MVEPTPCAHSLPRPQRWPRFLLPVLLAAAFALRLHELARQDIWWDEARNIDVALRPLAQIAPAPELDIQPPFYYWMLHGWFNAAGVGLGEDPARLAFVARFLSVAAGLVSTALLYPLGVCVFSPTAALFAVAVAAFSPFWLAESQETRMYTLGFALLAAAAWMLLRGIGDWRVETGEIREIEEIGNQERPVPSISFLAGFTLLSTLAILTHYNAVFVLVAWYGWWLGWALVRRHRWRQVRMLLLCGVATALLLTPMIPIALRQIPTYANPNLTVPTVGEYLSQNWQAYLGSYAFDPTGWGGVASIWLWAALALTVTGFLFIGLSRSPVPPLPAPSPPVFLFVWAIGGLVLYYVAVLDRGAFNVRYSSLITPALYLLIGGSLAAWGRWWRPLAAGALSVVLAGMIPALWADLYDPRFAREDIAGVTAWLRTVAGSEDLILVDQKYPFGFYYQRYAIDPAANPTGAEPAPARYLFVDINTVDQQLNKWAGQARQVFWVQWFESDTDPRHAVHFLLDKAGRHAGSQSFQGYSIDWWMLEPPNHFELAPVLAPATYRFPPAVETVAISLPDEPVTPGRGVPVVIRWRLVDGANGPPARPYKARVALYDAAGARLAQSDERLLNDRHLMPAEWAPADEPLNVYWLPLPDEITGGSYELRLLVYDGKTLEPLTLVDEAGNPAGQEATLGTVEIEP